MPDNSQMKLGKQPHCFDSRTLKLAKYLPPSWIPEKEVDFTNGLADWGMMRNDMLGDCTIAAIAHAVQTWTQNAGSQAHLVTVPDDQIVQTYSDFCGYVPGDASTDNGGVELDVLNLWRQKGFAGHQIVAYADPQPQNILHVKHAISRFMGIYIGLQLPVSAQDQDLWDVVPVDGGVWGGHAVWCLAYDPDELTCVTWGKLKKMTWDFWHRYCDESHCLFSGDLVVSHLGPELDMAALHSDLQSVVG